MQSQRCADADHPPPRLGGSSCCARRGKGIEAGQRQRNAGRPENVATSEFHGMNSWGGMYLVVGLLSGAIRARYLVNYFFVLRSSNSFAFVASHAPFGSVSQTQRFFKATDWPRIRSCTDVLSTSIRSPTPKATCRPSILAARSLPCISRRSVCHAPASRFSGTLSSISSLSPPARLLASVSSVLETEAAMIRPRALLLASRVIPKAPSSRNDTAMAAL